MCTSLYKLYKSNEVSTLFTPLRMRVLRPREVTFIKNHRAVTWE